MPDEKKRRKVTLVWNREDVTKVLASQFGNGPRYKTLDFPVAYYGWPQFDQVKGTSGGVVGHSCHCGYSANEGEMLSLAMLDAASAEPGTQIVLTWGGLGGGSRKPYVERDEQIEVRAIVAPVPYARSVQQSATDEAGRDQLMERCSITDGVRPLGRIQAPASERSASLMRLHTSEHRWSQLAVLSPR